MVHRRGADDHQVRLAARPMRSRSWTCSSRLSVTGLYRGTPPRIATNPKLRPASASSSWPRTRTRMSRTPGVGLEPHDREAVVGRGERVEHPVVAGVAVDGLDGRGPVREQDGVEPVHPGGDRAAVHEVPRHGAHGVLRDAPVQVRLAEAGQALVRGERVLADLRLAPHAPEQLLAVALGQVLQQQPAAVAEARARPVQLRAAHQVRGVPDAPGRGHGGQVGGAGGPERRGVVRGEAAGACRGRRSPARPRRSRGPAPRTGRTRSRRRRSGSPVTGAVADSWPRAVRDGDVHAQQPDAVDDGAGGSALGLGQPAALRHDDGAGGCAGTARPGPVDDDDDLVPARSRRPRRPRRGRARRARTGRRAGRRRAPRRTAPRRALSWGRHRPGRPRPGPRPAPRAGGRPARPAPTRRAPRRSCRPGGSARPHRRRARRRGTRGRRLRRSRRVPTVPSVLSPRLPLAWCAPAPAGWLPHCR